MLAAWRARVAAAAVRPPQTLSSPVAIELYRRTAIDSAARSALLELTAGLPAAEKAAATTAIWVELGKIDAGNSAFLETVMPKDGWFDDARDGKGVSARAWLIVQHSPDWRLKRDVLARLGPLVASGREPGSRYALLYDRIALHDGRPQRFGSQIECHEGRHRPFKIEDAAKVDLRRSEMGLEPLSSYLKSFGDRC